MFFILLTFLAALFIEALGSLISIIGVTKLFGPSAIFIALVVALDVGKVVTVSLLYQHWRQLSKLMKSYALVAALITMTITSVGAFGFLAGSFQTTIIGTKAGELSVGALQEQQKKYELRKRQIDDQIASLPPRTTVNQRLRLMGGFKQEQQDLDGKIAAIDAQLPKLRIAQLGTEARAGPIVYVAKAFDIPVEQAVKYVILLIVAVIDPLAIFLIVAGNFLWAQRQADLLQRKLEPPAEPRSISTEEAWEELHPTEPSPFEMTPEARPAVPTPATREAMHEARDIQTELREREFWAEQQAQSAENRRKFEAHVLAEQEAERLAAMDDLADSSAVQVPEPEASKPAYRPSGLLSPIVAEVQEPDEHSPVPTFSSGKREEITKSTLGLVQPDKETIVDAHRVQGFRKASTAVTSTKKQ